MISIRTSLFALILLAGVATSLHYGDLFKSTEEYVATCPAETIETLLVSDEEILEKNLEDPLQVCTKLQKSCCTKTVFTQGYNKFNQLLRQPIIEKLKEFKGIQTILYNLNMATVQTMLEKGAAEKPECMDYEGDLTQDISRTKMAKADLFLALRKVYNFVLRQYSGVICAACDSRYRTSLVTDPNAERLSTNLLVVLDSNTCRTTIANHLDFVKLTLNLYPLFHFSKTLKCLNGYMSDYLKSDFDLAKLQETRTMLEKCSLKENQDSSDCRQFCSASINLTKFTDTYNLLDYISDAHATTKQYLVKKPLIAKADDGEDSEDGTDKIDNSISEPSFTVFSLRASEDFPIDSLEIVYQEKDGIDLFEELMTRDYYKSAGIIATAAALLFAYTI